MKELRIQVKVILLLIKSFFKRMYLKYVKKQSIDIQIYYYGYIENASYISEQGQGWGNGYVVIPKGHSLYYESVDYIDHILSKYYQHIFQQEITLACKVDLYIQHYKAFNIESFNLNKDGYIIGFDTKHYGMNLDNWPKEKVIETTYKLKYCLTHLF